MQITTWNCNGAYRNKPHLDSDIIVIQECEKLAQPEWCIGDTPHKGIGIFSQYDMILHKDYNPEFRYVMPITVNGFNLFAVWAMNDTDNKQNRYISQVWRAINYYKKLLKEPSIIIGDFNWNIKWDAKASPPLLGDWVDVVNFLKDRDITSVYHKYFSEDFGKETQFTFYQYRDISKPYHIDYCFVSPHFKVNSVEVGKYTNWIQYSDHMPLTVDLQFTK
jgi:exodeoxyribonuclease-3